MAEKRRNISLKGYDDLFSSEESRQEDRKEKVQQIPLEDLHPFKNHPFRVVDDEAMLRTVESVSQYGVIIPAIARPLEGGGYEIIAGHRRKHAAELAGLTTLPVIIREMDDDAAVVFMVDSNLQREQLLPSERAWAYRMKSEAMKRQVGRPKKENVSQVGTQKRTDQLIAEESGVSRNQIQRFIRLTYLLPDLVEMVDKGRLAFNTAVELSYLSEEQQFNLLDAIDETQNLPSLSQAQRIKKLEQEDSCSSEILQEIMSEQKKPPEDRITLKGDALRKYFPKNFTPQQMEEVIVKLLKQWQRRHQMEHEL